jgi:DNA polymerase IV
MFGEHMDFIPMPSDLSHSTSIIHVDMDAFYASVEQRDHPDLRNKPVIVGGIAGRGVVSAASYEARKFGVHSAMPISTARRLCPDGIYVPVRMNHYADISQQIRRIFMSFTPLVEPLSLDEAFLDVRGCESLFGSPPEIARQIKERIYAETNLVASVGVAPNKFLAKLASDVGKPNGYVVIQPHDVTAFLEPLPIGRIWGIGKKTEPRFRAFGIHTIGQLAALPEKMLIDQFGELGRHAWQLANGRDDRVVVADREAKSISSETTFAEDIGDRQVLRTVLLDLVDQVASRLRREGIWARTIDLKIRSSEFRTVTRSTTIREATNSTDGLWRAASELFEMELPEELLPWRLLGFGVTKLTREAVVVQGDLFGDVVEKDKRRGDLDRTIDGIREQFGSAAIKRGSLIRSEEAKQKN